MTAQPCHLLVVEDEPDTRRAMHIVLSGSGYAVATAANGRDALEFLHRHPPPDLILLDLMMPDMDGWQFREQQSHDPALASVPVVVVSADDEAERKARQIGAAGCLAKPVEVDELLRTVHRYCA